MYPKFLNLNLIWSTLQRIYVLKWSFSRVAMWRVLHATKHDLQHQSPFMIYFIYAFQSSRKVIEWQLFLRLLFESPFIYFFLSCRRKMRKQYGVEWWLVSATRGAKYTNVSCSRREKTARNIGEGLLEKNNDAKRPGARNNICSTPWPFDFDTNFSLHFNILNPNFRQTTKAPFFFFNSTAIYSNFQWGIEGL